MECLGVRVRVRVKGSARVEVGVYVVFILHKGRVLGGCEVPAYES